MTAFRLNGYNGEKIEMELMEVPGFPDQTSHHGGYDIIYSLELKVGCFYAKCENLCSATGLLYGFAEQLKRCHESLSGNACYRDENLSLRVEMTGGGRAVATGVVKESSGKTNELAFEMPTDQSCFPSAIEKVEALKKEYGGMKGMK